MTANKKTIDFGYTKTMLKTDQNNPVVKEYVDAMKRGTNPNPTEKRYSVIQKKKIMLHKTKEYATDVIPTTIVESWEKEFDEKFTHTLQDDDEKIINWTTDSADIKQFISTQIQQAEERLVEKIKKEYNKRYQKIAKEHGLKRKTPHTMFHDVLATLKEEKDL